MSRADDKPSYLWEMLRHPISMYSFWGAVAGGAMISMGSDVGTGLLPLIAYATTAGLASLFIPGARWFRDKVDRRYSEAQREKLRLHLVQELQKRAGVAHPYWATYERMIERRNGLRKIAGETTTALTAEEVDRLDDITVHFLGLWLGRVAIHERAKEISAEMVDEKIASVEEKLGISAGDDAIRLRKAKNDLLALKKKREEMESREAAADAAMLSIADTFGELYQRVAANPTSRESVSIELKSAIERMNIEEELDFILEGEVEELLSV